MDIDDVTPLIIPDSEVEENPFYVIYKPYESSDSSSDESDDSLQVNRNNHTMQPSHAGGGDEFNGVPLGNSGNYMGCLLYTSPSPRDS